MILTLYSYLTTLFFLGYTKKEREDEKKTFVCLICLVIRRRLKAAYDNFVVRFMFINDNIMSFYLLKTR